MSRRAAWMSASVPDTWLQMNLVGGGSVVTERPRWTKVAWIKGGVTDRCDCGQVKYAGDECCPKCVYLDGETDRKRMEPFIISVLRVEEELTIAEIQDRVGHSHRHTLRALQRLLEAGRVRRWWQEFERPGVHWTRDRELTGGTATSGRWVYRLWG